VCTLPAYALYRGDGMRCRLSVSRRSAYKTPDQAVSVFAWQGHTEKPFIHRPGQQTRSAAANRGGAVRGGYEGRAT
jgi:hypothetical protein